MRLDPVRLAVAPLLRCQTDERLLELARAGHEPAFEAIVERYRRPLLRYCRRLLPASRAEDAVQQTFLGAYRAIRNGERELQLRPWLYRAAHNASVDALRQNGWDNEPTDKRSNGVERADEAWESREELRDLIASLRALPRRQRDAIVLRELEGRGHEEIAGMLGMSESAARQLIHRARAALRAGASALAPSGLMDQLLALVRADPVPSRIPELVAGGGTAAALAKLGATGLVASAVAVSGAHAPVPSGERVKRPLAAPEAAATLHAPAIAVAEDLPERLSGDRTSRHVPRSETARDKGAKNPSGDDGRAADRARRDGGELPASPRMLDDHPSEGFVKVERGDRVDRSVGERGGHRIAAEDGDDQEQVAIEEYGRARPDGERHDGVKPQGDEHQSGGSEDQD